eukprot:scaffold16844_cov119-Isochrysis_galbana.AAC.7
MAAEPSCFRCSTARPSNGVAVTYRWSRPSAGPPGHMYACLAFRGMGRKRKGTSAIGVSVDEEQREGTRKRGDEPRTISSSSSVRVRRPLLTLVHVYP